MQAEQADRLRDWTTGMFQYDKILSGLKEVTAAKTRDESSSDASSDSDGDAGKVKAAGKPTKSTVGKTAGKKAAAAAAGKKAAGKGKASKAAGKKQQASSSSSSSSEDDASSSSSSSSEDEAPKQATKLATHLGRYARKPSASFCRHCPQNPQTLNPQTDPQHFLTRKAKSLLLTSSILSDPLGSVQRYHKRERAKGVRGYSAHDLAAILGAAPGEAAGGSKGAENAAALEAAGQEEEQDGSFPRLREVRATHKEEEEEEAVSGGANEGGRGGGGGGERELHHKR
jgi:Pin2-interacting protein X1